ncbi:hypothetical protein G5B37_14645 [Rasiella rasia]|uniref:Sensor of ECF-type sigma factor n=1 Tax=Rasiella rasia TaxID=2744027 RepID=A0A6G6GQB7_9FLAO|nr:hypothetical protein [Rasiella rasia]QIE60748.1 hypothetical protein G5B37_14645 [Rasiella rasia]
MKNILFLLLFVATTTMIAQPDRHEKIKAYKVAHITEQLELTSEEATAFWPIYNASEEKMRALRKTERKEIMEKIRSDFETLSDAEANALIDKSIKLKQQELQVYSDLVANLKGKLPPKKIILLRKAEEDFKRKLLDRFKNRRNKD